MSERERPQAASARGWIVWSRGRREYDMGSWHVDEGFGPPTRELLRMDEIWVDATVTTHPEPSDAD